MKQSRSIYPSPIVALVGILLLLAACASKTTPPGANILSGTLMAPDGFGGAYTLLQWKEGLSKTIVDDVRGSRESSGTGSTDDPVWRGQGRMTRQNGQEITWRVETTDGQSAKFFINEQAYDLARGTLFMIRTGSETPEISQLPSRHDGTCSDDESCQQLLQQDPAVLQFTEDTLQSQ